MVSDTGGSRLLRERDEVPVMAVDTASETKPRKWSRGAGARKGFLGDGIASEFAFRDRFVNSSKI